MIFHIFKETKLLSQTGLKESLIERKVFLPLEHNSIEINNVI